MFLKRSFFSLVVVILASCSGSKSVSSYANTKHTNTSYQATETVSEGLEISLSQKQKDTTVYHKEPEKEIINSIILIPDHNLWSSLLEKHVSDNGSVNYNGFLEDKNKLRAYLKDLTENPPNDQWNRNQILAYWINAYNAFTVHLILRYYPLQSIKDIEKPWEQRFWKIGSKWYNLNDIEHQILRKMDEPRIHFAINCASVSCPKLLNEAYLADTLEMQLIRATRSFLSNPVMNEISEDEVKLSKIFQWFAKDFNTQDGTVLKFVEQYTSIDISENAKISYLTYNWDLND